VVLLGANILIGNACSFAIWVNNNLTASDMVKPIASKTTGAYSLMEWLILAVTMAFALIMNSFLYNVMYIVNHRIVA
jgi:hypothetical protein